MRGVCDEKCQGQADEVMAHYDVPDARVRRSLLWVVPAAILSLAAFSAVVALSAHAARVPSVDVDLLTRIGPICFYQHGHPTCIDRGGPNALADLSALNPEDLLVALLAGPTLDERAQGIESALPPGTQLVAAQADGISITVRLAFPVGFLEPAPTSRTDERLSSADSLSDPLTIEAIENQIYRTLFALGYRNISVEVEDPDEPGVFRPLSAFLPPLTVPPKGNAQNPSALELDSTLRPASQPPAENLGRPEGALTGKTIYLSAGHGWQWTGSNWYTQRPPYPDASMSYYGPIIEDHNNAEVVNQYLLRYLWNAGADVWTARERDMNSFERIVDNDTSGFGASGAWETVDADGYSNRYLRATTDASGSANATWTSDPVPADGIYSLYVWYVSGPDRARDAHYTVHHAGGATELTLDQLHHGHTWRYAGRFPLHSGERLVVTLSNRSSTPGRVVVADAIRLGGGWFDDGDLSRNGGPVETDAPYGPQKPWWEVAAYYGVQRLGVDPDDFSYFNDVVARPMWAKWEHANSGEDAVFVSWHTNGYNGHNTTTRGTVSFIHSYKAVAGSTQLRQAVHSELINDIRAGWDPSWVDLGQAARDLGELRELWDTDPGIAIPGVLLEIAYHDHATDTDALKDPRFALVSARAVYQGIVKYYGSDLPLLPEPPTHLVVRNDGPGQVRVSWRPSPVDGFGLVGDAAERYRVYVSRDGLGWDNGRDVSGTQTTLSGLEENKLIFVRVTAVNAGGESFPTPVLAARISSPDFGVAKTLVVNGFDRIDRHGLIIEDDPVEGVNARLFPDLINSYDYLIEHGKSIPVPFDSALNEAVAGGDLSLGAYGAVDWALGEESTEHRTFDATEQVVVADYLDNGGALFVSGAEIGWDLVAKGNGPDFYRTYLGADMAGDDADTYQVQPTAEGIFAGLGPIEFREGYDVDFPDQLTPGPGSIIALNYLGGQGGVAAVQYHGGGCRRIVNLGFPFETVVAAQRSAVMARVIDFFGTDGCLSLGINAVITSPPDGAAFNHLPVFEGTVSSSSSIARVEIQIVDPQGRYWDGQNWQPTESWLTASGTTSWQFSSLPNPGALIQGQYSVVARAWDAKGFSDTTPVVRFIYDTIPPAMPVLVAPSHGGTFSPLPTGYFWTGPSDDTGSPLGYDLQVGDQLRVASNTYYTQTIWLANGAHSWRARTHDAAGNYSSWTDAWTFTVDHKDWYFPVYFKNGAPLGP
jgi:N-acetylmuramoyl-L-alanine amidase